MLTLTIVWLDGDVTSKDVKSDVLLTEVQTLIDFAHVVKFFTVTPVR